MSRLFVSNSRLENLDFYHGIPQSGTLGNAVVLRRYSQLLVGGVLAPRWSEVQRSRSKVMTFASRGVASMHTLRE